MADHNANAERAFKPTTTKKAAVTSDYEARSSEMAKRSEGLKEQRLARDAVDAANAATAKAGKAARAAEKAERAAKKTPAA
jgi:hypothetical protein